MNFSIFFVIVLYKVKCTTRTDQIFIIDLLAVNLENLHLTDYIEVYTQLKYISSVTNIEDQNY